MKKYFLIVLVLISQSVVSQDWETHKNDNYEIKYPEDWRLDTSGRMNSSFIIFSNIETNDKFQENINLVIQDLSNQGFNLKSYAELSENQIKTMVPESLILQSISKDDYHETIWQGKIGSNLLKFKQLYFIKKEKAYILTLTTLPETFKKTTSIGDQILNSFKIKE